MRQIGIKYIKALIVMSLFILCIFFLNVGLEMVSTPDDCTVWAGSAIILSLPFIIALTIKIIK